MEIGCFLTRTSQNTGLNANKLINSIYSAHRTEEEYVVNKKESYNQIEINTNIRHYTLFILDDYDIGILKGKRFDKIYVDGALRCDKNFIINLVRILPNFYKDLENETEETFQYIYLHEFLPYTSNCGNWQM